MINKLVKFVKHIFFPSIEEQKKKEAADFKLFTESRSFTESDEVVSDKLKNSINDKKTKEVEEETKKKVIVSELRIYFVQGNFLGWTNEHEVGSNYFAWKDFYKWYLAKNTSFFVFKFINGETIFRREDILRVEYLKPVVKYI